MNPSLRILLIAALLTVTVGAMGQRRAKTVPHTTFEMADSAYRAYNLDEASELLNRFDEHFATDSDRVNIDALNARILLARNMLDRVERVSVIDSMEVIADDFFKFYRIASATGRLVDPSQLKIGGATADAPVYMTEGADLALWTGLTNDDEYPQLFETSLLADGRASESKRLATRSTLFADGEPGILAYPFLMTDGVTVYFAADGPGSLGGLDIFVARHDGENFLQPSNVGMPYNSPYNDYMMVIDEVTGLGWLATDRNDPDGETVTVYTFIPSDVRVNYPSDTEDIVQRAMLHNILPEASASDLALLDRLNDPEIMGTVKDVTETPLFSLPDGRIVRSVNDLNSELARQRMTEFEEAQNELRYAVARLDGMRQRYAEGQMNLAESILDAEADIEKLTARVDQAIVSIIVAEMSSPDY